MARDRKPDLILLDLSLPYPDGLPILEKIKAHPETASAPILMVYQNPVEISEQAREAIGQTVHRPVDMDRLINYVRRALGEPELEIAPKPFSDVDDHLYSW